MRALFELIQLAASMENKRQNHESATAAEYVKYLFKYDAETGDLTRTTTVAINAMAGQKVSINNGYYVTKINGRKYFAHRVAWAIFFGEWPNLQIDHINGNGLDNRLCNLRPATSAQNNRNTALRSSNKSGFKGVCRARNGKWRASILVNGKQKYLGCFSKANEAHLSYVNAANELFGDFAYSGEPRSVIARAEGTVS